MAILDFHATRNEINQILLNEIDMPNFKSILNEPVRVFVHSLDNKDLEKIKTDSDDPLNIRFRMDQIDEKIPRYDCDDNNKHSLNPIRKIQFSEKVDQDNSDGIKVEFSEKNDKILSGKYEYNFTKNEIIEGNWSFVFANGTLESKNKFVLPKTNAIVINDNYLFNNINIKNKENSGVMNIEKLLSTIMPFESAIDFHISIFTSEVKWDFNTAEKYFNRIHDFLKFNFSYPIFLELVIWQSTDNHKRMLISNYYIATCDKGFNLFDENDKITDTNDILIRRIFHDVEEPGETPYFQSVKRLKKLQKTHHDAKSYCSKATQMLGKIYISSDPDGLTMNRLLFS